MMTADQVVKLLREAATYTSDARVRVYYDTLMGQLAAQLVGEPLEDGEISDAEWVMLACSLRQLSASPRGTAAWATLRQQAATLETALEQVKSTPQVAVRPVSPVPAWGGLSSLRAAWTSAFSRARTPQPQTQTNVNQNFDSIVNSPNFQVIGVVKNGSPTRQPEVVVEADEEDTAPLTPPMMQSGRKCDVFLSYSRRDPHQMNQVRDDLIAAGFEVWTDDSLQPGSASWLRAIEEAIAMSLCVVVLLSPDSKSSEWVEKELVTARNYDKQIIPLLIRGDERTSVPFLLATCQFADARNAAKYTRVMSRLVPVLTNLKRGAQVRA